MNKWEPTKKQAEFLSLPYSIKEAFYAGAVGAGKSDVLLLYPIIHKFHENPKFKGLFLRRTYGELELEIIPRSKGFYTKVGGKYNKNDKIWTFPSGALIFFGHVENEDDVHKYDSAQPNYVAFDELTSFTEWQYLYITLQRVRRDLNSNLPAIVRSASNPGNTGHNWVRKRFIDPAPEGRKLILGKSGIKRIFIPARIKDNPHIDPEYIKSLEALPEAEKQAKLYGRWDAFEGSVFEEFRDKQYPDEPDNALHVIKPFDIPAFWPRIVSIDWGYAPPAMTWVGFGAVSPDSRLHIYREMSWQKTKIEEWAAYVKEYVDIENPRTIKVCKSAGQDRGQEHTILAQISNALGRSVELTNNNPGSRVANKMLIHEYLRWSQKYKPVMKKEEYSEFHAEYLLRTRGPKEYQSYLDSFTDQPDETNLPKLQIFNSCPILISALKSCIYDKNNPQDVAEFAGDDPYDGLRYLVDTADRFFSESALEFEKLRKQEVLVKELEETKDWTSFYRNAKNLETNQKVTAIRRYHRAG